ncbi:MAG: YggT family protein [Candidatus Obscuribacterales bacterium]|jgi:YggT family protein
MNPVLQILDGVIQLISMALFLWCLLSWFPNINWKDQPFVTLDNIIRPIIAPIQRIVPPISGFDLSPIVLVVLLNFVQNGLHMVLH